MLLIDFDTFLKLGKLLLCSFGVTVDLPAADTFNPCRLVFNKALDILARIAEEQYYLMWEILALTYTLHQFYYTLFATFGKIAAMRQKISNRVIIKKLCLAAKGDRHKQEPYLYLIEAVSCEHPCF